MFDDTPGKAEVTFTGGLSNRGSYAGDGSCNNLYCHGSGRSSGSYTDADAKPSCSGCHGSTPAEASGMSGQHARHLNLSDITCTNCHSTVVDGSKNIIGADLHVNGQVELQMESGVQFANGECNGTCHGTQHGYFGFGFAW
jgi:predicted CxxxxCH...CXXCH cytochrome family protein